MSQPQGVWQTNRAPNSQVSSKAATPQNRSSTNSPSQQAQPSQPPKSNPWNQNRSSSGAATHNVNGPAAASTTTTQSTPQGSHGFNAAEVKGLLAKGVSGQSYKVSDEPATGGKGGAWGGAASESGKGGGGTMANGQQFFQHLAKQVAIASGEGGG